MLKIRYIRLDGLEYSQVSRYAALLPPERQEKISRLRFDRDKLLSLAAGLLIRYELGDQPLLLNEHGKPYIPDSSKHFSVSHSGTSAVIAVDDAEVGADVEQLPAQLPQKVAERFFHPNELRYLNEADDPYTAFTVIWTQKEAYIKQLGIGLSADLRGFDTTSDLRDRMTTFYHRGYVYSVCTEQKPDPSNMNIVKVSFDELIR